MKVRTVDNNQIILYTFLLFRLPVFKKLYESLENMRVSQNDSKKIFIKNDYAPIDIFEFCCADLF